MSIAPARRVSSSSPSVKIEKNYGTGSQNEQFVEVIDTNNNVLIRDESNPEHHTPFYQKPRQEEQKDITPSVAYVANSIEAMDETGNETPAEYQASENSDKVGVYDNNQSIIKDEELDRTGRNYLKHFYEKNEYLQEVDKLI